MNPSLTLDDHRTAQADALAHAGADERARREAERREVELTALIDAAEQRTQAERLAAEQAEARATNEAQVRRLAIEKARAEQEAEAALRAHHEAAEHACAEARRKEQALADLAAASAARAKREADILALEKEKVAAERAAIAAAQERIQSEQMAESLALTRVATEQETARLAAQRLVVDQELAAATRAREQAEAEARTAKEARQAIAGGFKEPVLSSREQTIPIPAVQHAPAPPKRIFNWRAVLLAIVCLAIGIWVGKFVGAEFPAQPVPTGNGQLKLDTRLTHYPTLRP